MKVLVAGRMMLETDKAGEEIWGLWAADVAPVIRKFGLLTEYMELGAGEPRSEIVRRASLPFAESQKLNQVEDAEELVPIRASYL